MTVVCCAFALYAGVVPAVFTEYHQLIWHFPCCHKPFRAGVARVIPAHSQAPFFGERESGNESG